MKEIDDTDPPEGESERQIGEIYARLVYLEAQVAILKDALKKAQVELADLHWAKRVSRGRRDDSDPEWFS